MLPGVHLWDHDAQSDLEYWALQMGLPPEEALRKLLKHARRNICRWDLEPGWRPPNWEQIKDPTQEPGMSVIPQIILDCQGRKRIN